ncbi:MAG: NADH-quinone oxidoreductase subunit N [bacterium]|nr:NADH-quinone oxidoreductase subunit N [bacterium]
MTFLSSYDLWAALPESLLALTALLLLIADGARRGQAGGVTLPGISVAGLLASAVAAMSLWGQGGTVFGGLVFDDGFASFFSILFAVIGILTILFSPHYLRVRGMRLGEYYALLLLAIFGMTVMVKAASLLVLFLGLETMSVALYVLAGLQRSDAKSAEAGMKYLVLGAFSSGFLLYGIALLYTVVGSIGYEDIALYLAAGNRLSPLLVAGIGLLLVGFAFKCAAVPFHFWSPDVYDGAPATITAFMSTGPKAAAFVALIRVFGVTLASASSLWITAITWLAILTMTVGNVVALRQTSVKRMLAYSSIAHAGYLLVGIVAGTKVAFVGMGYYLAAYALMNLGAFAVIILLNRRSDSGYALDDLKGMGFAHPVLGIAMAVFMLSLTGVPPTAGFFGKLYVFSAAIQQGHIALAIVGLLNSAVAAYYYLRVIVFLYMARPEGDPMVSQPPIYRAALIVCSLLILLVGIFPEQLLSVLTLAVP